MRSETSAKMLALLRKAFWQSEAASADAEVLEEMNHHAVAALAAPVLQDADLPPELAEAWKKAAIRALTRSTHIMQQEQTLPVTVPYAILKGSSAAQYYPMPEFRAQGDIDIMTRRVDFEAACGMFLANGYEEIASEEENRHREFVRNHVLVEVHRYFASLNSPEAAEYMDNLIVDNIGPGHRLPDLINGLVILEHISQHLEHGLGLRQVLDWMFFVNSCLPDERWPEFQVMAQATGLELLAKALTRMCELDLGLPERRWCSDADEKHCRQLMDYILACGNFGAKFSDDKHSYAVSTLAQSRTLKGAFQLLSKRGRAQWKAARSSSFLRHFAWLYQLGKYIRLGLGRKSSLSHFRDELSGARQINALFDALGVKQTSKGLAVYKDGTYQK